MRLGTWYRMELLRRLGFQDVTGRVLDVGGFDGVWAASLRSATPVVVDLDPRRGLDVPFVAADGCHLPFPDTSFDVVFAFDVMEHVEAETDLLRELGRVTRTGGQLVVTTPDVGIAVFPRFLQPWVNRRWGHHRVPGFTPEHVREVVQEAGTAEVQVTSIRAGTYRFWYLPLRLLWRVAPGPGRYLVAKVAARDASRLEGRGGYVLAHAVRVSTSTPRAAAG